MALDEELFDPLTIEYLERIGVPAGCHALELGVGRLLGGRPLPGGVRRQDP